MTRLFLQTMWSSREPAGEARQADPPTPSDITGHSPWVRERVEMKGGASSPKTILLVSAKLTSDPQAKVTSCYTVLTWQMYWEKNKQSALYNLYVIFNDRL